MVSKPLCLVTGLGAMSATTVTPGSLPSPSRMASKRGVRNCIVSWVNRTTAALPPSLALMCAMAASVSALPVAYCGALSSNVAGGGTIVPTKPPDQITS